MGPRVLAILLLVFAAGGLVGYVAGSKITYTQLEPQIVHYNEYGEIVIPSPEPSYEHTIDVTKKGALSEKISAKINETIKVIGVRGQLTIYAPNGEQDAVVQIYPYVTLVHIGNYIFESPVGNITVEVVG